MAIYFNDNGTPFTDEIDSFTVTGNILNEGVVVSNGVGIPTGDFDTSLTISNNTFEGTFDVSTGLGRYDTVVLNGQVPGIGWLLESNALPRIFGNQFGDNSTPFLLRGSDISAANLPNASQIGEILQANGNADTTYAYVLKPNGDLELASRNFGAFFSFAVANTIDTLELALEPAGGNTVFPDQRFYVLPGDTVVIQSGPNALNSTIDVDGLEVQANDDSAHLTLTLGIALPDGTPVTVQSLTLIDYAAGLGANVNVVGNDLGDTIQSDHGTHVIATGSGADTITGGGGTDTINAGGGADTIVYNVAAGGTEIVDGGSGTDTQVVSNVGGGAETFNINPINSSHVGVNIEPGANNATVGPYEISDTNVEEIVVHLGGAGDTVLVSGNLGGTGVLTSTITVEGGAGADTVDGSHISSAYPVDLVFQGNGGNDTFVGGPGVDTSVYADFESSYTYTTTSDSNGFVTSFASVTDTNPTLLDEGTDTLSSVERLVFQNTDGPGGALGDTMLDLTKAVQLFDATNHLIGTFDTIQSAVNAATNGDTVLASAGVYKEQVLIDGKDLTLKGEPGAIIEAPDTLQVSFALPAGATSTPNKFALVGVENNANVTVEGFSIEGRGLGDQTNGGDFAGVYFWNSSGHVLNSTVTGIRNGGASGSFDGIQHGNGIVGFVTDGSSHSLEVGNYPRVGLPEDRYRVQRRRPHRRRP